MTDLRKAAKMALEALDGLSEPYDVLKAQEALRQALAQPEQEPVVYLDEGLGAFYWPNQYKKGVGFTPLYAVPPHRWSNVTDDCLMEEVRRRGFVIRDAQVGKKWVGLTDADKQEAFDETQEASGGFWDFADYLEAKLKEKNT